MMVMACNNVLADADLPTSAVPTIEISFAPAEEMIVSEPYSPFLSPINTSFSLKMDDMDSYRPALLSPPVPPAHMSSLRTLPASRPNQAGKGIDNDRFQELLRASKEKSSNAAKKVSLNLRKEVAIKAHKSKQLERRALFLSKLGAPPSPSAVSMPKTPPESPAIFHYSLPSPGLVSPLALFETLGLDDPEDSDKEPRKVWVEQVDFRLQKQRDDPTTPTIVVTPSLNGNVSPLNRGHRKQSSIPSLAQITQRYGTQAAPTIAAPPSRTPIPLPAFLSQPRNSSSGTPTRQPLRAIQLPRQTTPPSPSKPLPCIPVPERRDSLPQAHAELQVTTTHVPRTSTNSSTVKSHLTAANLTALNSRQSTARQMLSAIQRRTGMCGSSGAAAKPRPVSLNGGLPMLPSCMDADAEDADRRSRRNSAPGEMVPGKGRLGFMHPVLQLPGGF